MSTPDNYSNPYRHSCFSALPLQHVEPVAMFTI